MNKYQGARPIRSQVGADFTQLTLEDGTKVTIRTGAVHLGNTCDIND